MAARIIINGKEITNPFIRTFLIFSAILVTALVMAGVIFVLLPIIGIAVSLSVGFIVIFIVASLASVVALTLFTLVSAWLFGAFEFRIERFRRRKQ